MSESTDKIGNDKLNVPKNNHAFQLSYNDHKKCLAWMCVYCDYRVKLSKIKKKYQLAILKCAKIK